MFSMSKSAIFAWFHNNVFFLFCPPLSLNYQKLLKVQITRLNCLFLISQKAAWHFVICVGKADLTLESNHKKNTHTKKITKNKTKQSQFKAA